MPKNGEYDKNLRHMRLPRTGEIRDMDKAVARHRSKKLSRAQKIRWKRERLAQILDFFDKDSKKASVWLQNTKFANFRGTPSAAELVKNGKYKAVLNKLKREFNK